jgi:hypothetical protein
MAGQDSEPPAALPSRAQYARDVATDDVRARIQHFLVTGDNRLKQGAGAAKARQSYEQALALAREAGVEDTVRPLVEVRLAGLERLAGGSPPPGAPAH